MRPSLIVLVGMPASGKSRVGRELAAHLGTRHFDSDVLIEAQEGRSIPEIFASDGEDIFRSIEEDVISQALSLSGVLSLGGGALTREATRRRLREHFVVYIRAELPELLRRSAGSNRPLLSGDAEAWLKQLWLQRKDYFDEVASLTVDSTPASSSFVVDQIIQVVEECS